MTDLIDGGEAYVSWASKTSDGLVCYFCGSVVIPQAGLKPEDVEIMRKSGSCPECGANDFEQPGSEHSVKMSREEAEAFRLGFCFAHKHIKAIGTNSLPEVRASMEILATLFAEDQFSGVVKSRKGWRPFTQEELASTMKLISRKGADQ